MSPQGSLPLSPPFRQSGQTYDNMIDRHPKSGILVALVVALSAKRLLPLAQTAAGHTGSARNFRRAVAEAKKAWRRRRPVYRPWQPTPGEHLVIAWTTEAGWQIFCAVLHWEPVAVRAHGPRPEGGHHLRHAAHLLEAGRRH